MAAEIFSRPPVFHFCVSDVDRCDGLPVLLSGVSGTAIDIAESNKEGFQYLQTGFYIFLWFGTNVGKSFEPIIMPFFAIGSEFSRLPSYQLIFLFWPRGFKKTT